MSDYELDIKQINEIIRNEELDMEYQLMTSGIEEEIETEELN